jgi:hypothetical protein
MSDLIGALPSTGLMPIARRKSSYVSMSAIVVLLRVTDFHRGDASIEMTERLP